MQTPGYKYVWLQILIDYLSVNRSVMEANNIYAMPAGTKKYFYHCQKSARKTVYLWFTNIQSQVKSCHIF